MREAGGSMTRDPLPWVVAGMLIGGLLMLIHVFVAAVGLGISGIWLIIRYERYERDYADVPLRIELHVEKRRGSS
jgi:hypothetical protein